jgi:hypothetical protein
VNIYPKSKFCSADRMPDSLPFAMEETELVRLLIKSKDLAEELIAKKLISQRLLYLNRDIEFIEVELSQARSRAIS